MAGLADHPQEVDSHEGMDVRLKQREEAGLSNFSELRAHSLQRPVPLGRLLLQRLEPVLVPLVRWEGPESLRLVGRSLKIGVPETFIVMEVSNTHIGSPSSENDGLDDPFHWTFCRFSWPRYPASRGSGGRSFSPDISIEEGCKWRVSESDVHIFIVIGRKKLPDHKSLPIGVDT